MWYIKTIHILCDIIYLLIGLRKGDGITELGELCGHDFAIYLNSTPFLVLPAGCRELDCRYLQFVCEVVEDILSRGVLSEPAMDLLFQTHVDHHKNHLREVSVHISMSLSVVTLNEDLPCYSK